MSSPSTTRDPFFAVPLVRAPARRSIFRILDGMGPHLLGIESSAILGEERFELCPRRTCSRCHVRPDVILSDGSEQFADIFDSEDRVKIQANQGVAHGVSPPNLSGSGWSAHVDGAGRGRPTMMLSWTKRLEGCRNPGRKQSFYLTCFRGWRGHGSLCLGEGMPCTAVGASVLLQLPWASISMS